MCKIKQPEWCDYTNATEPVWGCWSLLNGNVSSKDECIKYNCECCKYEPIVFNDIKSAMRYINNAEEEIIARKNKLYNKWGRLLAIVNISNKNIKK
jgi:hypothetical protein